jgi:phenylpropionate dioxygenase-like ring-hydroxylating dioxygenase large terminal subunit
LGRGVRGIFRDAMIDDPILVNEWHLVARSRDIGAGQVRPVRLLGRDIVLWRESERGATGFVAEAKPAAPHAWLDLCLHRGAKLSGGRVVRAEEREREQKADAARQSAAAQASPQRVYSLQEIRAPQQGTGMQEPARGADPAGAAQRKPTITDCLACPYHGWEYDASGKCVRIPAAPAQPPPEKAQATVFKAQDKYGFVWVCLGEPRVDVPEFSEWGDTTYRKVEAGPYMFRAQGPRIIENFLDVGHFPFVHAGLLGDAKHAEVADYEVQTTDDGLEAKDIPGFQPDPDGTGWGGEVRYLYRVLRPLTAYFVKTQAGGKKFAMINFVTPVDEGESTSWAVMAINYADETTDQQLRDFQDKITAQDIPIVESQRPELLPLDLQAELHLKSDRAAIAYRSWLKKVGLKYGTA